MTNARTTDSALGDRRSATPSDPDLPLASVILPLRNADGDEASLTAQHQSVVTANIQVVLVDDGSEDDTPARLKEPSEIIPSVRFLIGDGQGVARARNLALAHARCEYIWFADGEDAWSPQILTVLVAWAQESGVDIVAFNPHVDNCQAGMADMTASPRSGQALLFIRAVAFSSRPSIGCRAPTHRRPHTCGYCHND